MKPILLGALLATLSSLGLAQVTVQVSAPTPSETTASPIYLQASASSTNSITGWQVYLDSNNVYTGGPVGTINTAINAGNGSHQLVVRAWDSTGAYGSQTINLTVSANALPVPPPTATVYSNLQNGTPTWGNCGSTACAGGTGEGSYWQAFNQTSPSLSGSSMELYRDGQWANALWYHDLGANNTASNFLFDFYLQLDSASLNSAQALEFDVFQFAGGYNYMVGSQCDYGYGVWDTWNEQMGNWIHTNISCPKFSPNIWHHIQWYMTTNQTNQTYTYRTLVVDGVSYTVNQTYSAANLGWANNVGAQWQLDVNAGGGGYHAWVDQANLTAW